MFIKWIKEIWQKKLFIIYICFLSVLLVCFINNFAFGKEYTYSFSYYVTNSELAKLTINIDTLKSDVQMANSCRILLESDYTLNTVGEMLVKKYGREYLENYFTFIEDEDGVYISTDSLREYIDVSVVSKGISVLSIDVTAPNRYLAQDIGDFIAYLTPNVIYRIIGVSYTSPFNNSRMTVKTGLLRTRTVLAGGLIIGFVLSLIIIAVYKQFYKNIIMSKEDVESCLKAEIYTLGDIPYYEFKLS